MMQDLKNKTFDEIQQLVARLGEKNFLAGYIFSFVHRQGAADISDITPLSKAFRTQLTEQGYYISQLKKIHLVADTAGTAKYLFELPDGNRIEAVLLPDAGRKTVCISTQAGCPMNCTFCATAKLGFHRNLTTAEIVDQVYSIRNDNHKISNVVYMGMGEPLKNYDPVVRSIRILNHPDGINIGTRHLTVSTCGIPDAIEKLVGEDVHPRLAISLNAPTDTLRNKLMPVNHKYPIASILKAVRSYQLRTARRVTFEYVLIKDLNDKADDARSLARLVKNLKCNVNLIEYNPHQGCDFAASSKKVIKRFADVLEQAGIETNIRFRKGRKINAGCGQLGSAWLADSAAH